MSWSFYFGILLASGLITQCMALRESDLNDRGDYLVWWLVFAVVFSGFSRDFDIAARRGENRQYYNSILRR